MNVVRKAGLILLALTFAMTVVGPAFGQATDAEARKHEIAKLDATRQPWSSPGWGGWLRCWTQSSSAVRARFWPHCCRCAGKHSAATTGDEPGRVQTAMIIIGALLEGATFFALIICIQIAGKA